MWNRHLRNIEIERNDFDNCRWIWANERNKREEYKEKAIKTNRNDKTIKVQQLYQ
jgi:hypothetical protein